MRITHQHQYPLKKPIPNMSDKGDDVAHINTVAQHDSSSSPSGDVAGGSAISPAIKRGLQPPEFLVHMTAEERQELETKLKRKIDLRLMPAIILMVSAVFSSLWSDIQCFWPHKPC